jgi:hypothetical protein
MVSFDHEVSEKLCALWKRAINLQYFSSESYYIWILCQNNTVCLQHNITYIPLQQGVHKSRVPGRQGN